MQYKYGHEQVLSIPAWAIDGFYGLLYFDLGIGGIVKKVGMLLVMSVIFFGVACHGSGSSRVRIQNIRAGSTVFITFPKTSLEQQVAQSMGRIYYRFCQVFAPF